MAEAGSARRKTTIFSTTSPEAENIVVTVCEILYSLIEILGPEKIIIVTPTRNVTTGILDINLDYNGSYEEFMKIIIGGIVLTICEEHPEWAKYCTFKVLNNCDAN